MRDKDREARVNELRARFWQAKRLIKACRMKTKDAKPEVREEARAHTSSTSISRPFSIEIFSGCGRLTAALKAVGLDAVAIDYARNKDAKSGTFVSLDLLSDEGTTALFVLLDNPNLVYVHIAPPCGTATRAREIRRRAGPDPQ
eukprot:12244015-Karenia_brevis.AAC.1